ncbi:exosortase A [Syntrophotalea acetylenica]|uniref:exosortase A n=1 Tax=Syntrophotalea acetylenica TaxID=29542 RepID=UPI002A36914F|nr:exosortase A [Syntrophotalea acetylenica]MDY0263350.1 exosortase/archaeosortase family protein [Syntrophotalea acetylenica]
MYRVESEVTFSEFLQRNRWHVLMLLLCIAVTYRNVVPGMVSDWDNDPNYSHGFLVPLISTYFVWQSWAQIRNIKVRPSLFGLLVVVGSLALLILGYVGTEYYTMRSSLVFLLAGVILFWCGWAILRALALPVGFLLFMVPLPYIVYDAVAFPLKLMVAKFSVFSLKMLGVVVWRDGNIIRFPQTVLEVADACSGLRSLMSLLALAVAYAFISQTSNLKRTVLVLSAIPIAIFTNMVRVIVTGILAQYYGAAAAEGFFHEFAGFVVFAVAMVLLFLFGMLLHRWGKS